MTRRIQRMFSSIAEDYDRTNRVLSLGADDRWRRRAVRLSRARPGDRVLDVACGTGDLTLAFAHRWRRRGRVVGLDFSRPMLDVAVRKDASAHVASFLQGDALHLPFRDGAFDVASIGFGVRNLDDPVAGLREMARVVRPGGSVVVLEFGQPKGIIGPVYRLYSRHVMPRVGGWLTGNREAYEYLPRTAAAFPAGDAFVALMDEAGVFADTAATRLTGGIAYVYTGRVDGI
jgi:demethylmenaquinone methyltransferase/2-methoxy-6-polyprenyl-1,4-benzoquinol methylase